MRQAEYTDAQGVKRLVLLPDDVAADPAEGIPVDLDVETLYPHMPPAFIARLKSELWARGLVQPRDYLTPGAPERIRAALLATVKEDTMSILALARERATHHEDT